MRLFELIVMSVLAAVAMAGCSLFQETPEEKFEKALDDSADISAQGG